MSKKTDHPSDEQLSAFALGQLPAIVAKDVEEHISGCDTCCETMMNLADDDTFVDLVQRVGSTESGIGKDDQDTIPVPLQQHPRYQCEEIIGRGGMGRVYMARHRMMDRAVALKVIHAEWVRKQEAIDRFRREVKTAASLDHPNIVTAHDAEQAGDLHLLVMEYVDGVDLAQTVQKNGPLPIEQACDYVRQAATGLQYAHDRGMVHRDIKPHNLMVTSDNVVKILDFGLASLAPQTSPDEPISEDADGNLTVAGSIMGTPDFISPEQAVDARNVDGRSDIYSLGMTLYFLLAGRRPFEKGSAMDKLKLHAEAEPTPLTELRDDLPKELLKVVERMIAKDPTKRFQSPAEVATSLEPFTTEQQTEPESEIKPRTLQQGRGGNRWAGVLALLAAAAAGGFLLLGLLGNPKRDYADLRAYLKSGGVGSSNMGVDPAELAGRLLKSEEGHEFLRDLDQELNTLAFIEDVGGKYSSLVLFAHANPTNKSRSVVTLRGNQPGVSSGGTSFEIHESIVIDSIAVKDGGSEKQVVVDLHTRKDVELPPTPSDNSLRPGSRYKDKFPLSKLFEPNFNFAFGSSSYEYVGPMDSEELPEQLPGGGPESIAAEMLRGMTLSYDNVSWTFSDDTVEIRNNGEEIPAEFAKEILGREVAPKTITASWALAEGNRQLKLTDIHIDRERVTREVSLPIMPAGWVCVNLGAHQYSKQRTDRSDQVVKPFSYDFTQVPGNATQIIGYRPEEILRDDRFARLRNQRLPLGGYYGLFANEDVREILDITMPREGTTFSVKLVSVAEGSVMELVDRALGIRDRESMSENDSPYYETNHLTNNGPTYVRRVNRKTAIIGLQKDLVAHQTALDESPNTELIELTSSMQDSLLFGIADKMTADEAKQLVIWAEDFGIDVPVKNIVAVWKNSDYLAASVSLGRLPMLQILAKAKEAEALEVIADELPNLPKSAKLLSQLLAVDDQGQFDKSGKAIVAAIDRAAVAKSLGNQIELTVPLGTAEKPLLKMMNLMLDAEQNRKFAAKFALQQIALGFLNFHEVNGYLPSSSTKLPDAKHPVSWRVAILPFLEQQALYDQYKFDEPWGSENNKKLIDKMPAIYRHPNTWQRSTNASHVVFVGKTAAGTDALQVTLEGITDGTSNTILVAEAATSIPWTKPEDLEFDASKKLPPVGGLSRAGWQAAMVDGSVNFIPSETSTDVIKALITRAGGEELKQEGERFSLPRNNSVSSDTVSTKNAADEFDAVAKKALAGKKPNTEAARNAANEVALKAWPLTLKPMSKELADVIVRNTQPDLAVRMEDRAAEAGRPVEGVGFTVQIVHAIALAHAGDIDSALKENRALLNKVSINIQKGRLPDMPIELFNREHSPKVVQCLLTMHKALILNLANRSDESKAAMGEAQKLFPQTATKADELAIRELGLAIVDPAEIEKQRVMELNWNKTREVGKAILAYHDKHGHFPARASRSDNGSPLLSWRVALLPHLGEDELYGRFRLDEPWNSEHNMKLLPLMPVVFQFDQGDAAKNDRTQLVVPVLKGSLWSIDDDEKRTVKALRDGTSNTMATFVAPAKDAVLWTKPDDLLLAPDTIKQTLFGDGQSCNAGLFDGSAIHIRRGATKKDLVGLVTIDGGEKVDLSALVEGRDSARAPDPFGQQGQVDYLEFVNQQLSAGVTPDQNWEVAVRQIAGPIPTGEGDHFLPGWDEASGVAYYQRLGIAPPESDAEFPFPDARFPGSGKNATPEERELSRAFSNIEGPWSATDHPKLAAWLTSNADWIDKAVAESRRSRCYLPLARSQAAFDAWIEKFHSESPKADAVPKNVADFVMGDHPSVMSPIRRLHEVEVAQHSRSISRVLRTRALLRIGEGNTQEGLEDILALHRIARLLAQGTPDQAMFGIVIENIACYTAASMLESGKLNRNMCRDYLASLEKLPPIVDDETKYFELARCQTLAAMQTVGTQEKDKLQSLLKPAPSAVAPETVQRIENIDWAAACGVFNRRFDELMKVLDESDPSVRRYQLEKIAPTTEYASGDTQLLRDIRSAKDGKAVAELIGEAYYSTALANRPKMLASVRALLVVIKAACAANLYHHEHGAFPDDVAKLDAILSKPAIDPLDGNPVRILKRDGQFIVYSIGPNLVDNEGESSGRDADDFAVRFDIAEFEARAKADTAHALATSESGTYYFKMMLGAKHFRIEKKDAIEYLRGTWELDQKAHFGDEGHYVRADLGDRVTLECDDETLTQISFNENKPGKDRYVGKLSSLKQDEKGGFEIGDVYRYFPLDQNHLAIAAYDYVAIVERKTTEQEDTQVDQASAIRESHD